MRRLAKILTALLALPLTYLLAAWLLGSVVLTPEDAAGDDITVYLITNGIHTDLALPLKNDTFDWTTIINPGDTRAASSDWGYAAFGWGDRGFYVETPHWRDLKISTALSAVSGLGDSIIHVTYYPTLWESTHSIAIPMPRAQYRRLAASIHDQFALHEGRAIVAAPAYGDNDTFYAARGHYSLFHTCNSWTNRRLSDAGLKHVLWTPFAHSLMQAYRSPADTAGRLIITN